MDIIGVPCPSCASVLRVSREHIGKSGRCNRCGQRIVIDPASHSATEEDNYGPSLEALADPPPSLEKLIDNVYDLLATPFECDFESKAVLFLVDNQAGGLRLTTTRGQFSGEFLRDEAFVPLGRCLCGRAAQSGTVLVCTNCFDDPRHDNHWLGMQTHGHYVIPLTHEGRVLGVLTLYTRTGVQANARRMALLAKVGAQAGNGLQRFLLLTRHP